MCMVILLTLSGYIVNIIGAFVNLIEDSNQTIDDQSVVVGLI